MWHHIKSRFIDEEYEGEQLNDTNDDSFWILTTKNPMINVTNMEVDAKLSESQPEVPQEEYNDGKAIGVKLRKKVISSVLRKRIRTLPQMAPTAVQSTPLSSNSSRSSHSSHSSPLPVDEHLKRISQSDEKITGEARSRVAPVTIPANVKVTLDDIKRSRAPANHYTQKLVDPENLRRTISVSSSTGAVLGHGGMAMNKSMLVGPSPLVHQPRPSRLMMKDLNQGSSQNSYISASSVASSLSAFTSTTFVEQQRQTQLLLNHQQQQQQHQQRGRRMIDFTPGRPSYQQTPVRRNLGNVPLDTPGGQSVVQATPNMMIKRASLLSEASKLPASVGMTITREGVTISSASSSPRDRKRIPLPPRFAKRNLSQSQDEEDDDSHLPPPSTMVKHVFHPPQNYINREAHSMPMAKTNVPTINKQLNPKDIGLDDLEEELGDEYALETSSHALE